MTVKIKTFLSSDRPSAYAELDDEVNEFIKNKNVIQIIPDTPHFNDRYGITFGHKITVVYEVDD